MQNRAIALRKLAFGVEPSNRGFRLRLARYQAIAETLAEFLPSGPSRVLDAGCGKGRVALYWTHNRFAGKEPVFVGADISPSRMGMAAERGYAQLVRANLLEPWPFADATFDAAVLEQVIEHFDDGGVHHLLSELARVVKPGGFVIVGTPVFQRVALWLAPIWRRWKAWQLRRTNDPSPGHLQHLMVHQVVERVEAHGLKPIRVSGVRLFSLPGALLEDSAWYYRLHRRVGARFPGLCVEASIVARKSAAP